MKKIIIHIFLISSMTSFAQIDLESMFEGGTKDAQTLLRGYIEPLAAGFGNGINGGWYTTAKTHKLFGIDIAVIVNAAIVPTEGETFTFNQADYDNIKLYDGGTSAELPTFFGSQDLADRPLLQFSDSDGNGIVSTSALPGAGLKDAIGYNIVPSPMIQAGIGLFKNTDLKIRFVPKQSDTDYEFSTFGIGVMHDIKQWIPFVKKLPFDVSVLAAWNDVKSKVFLDSENHPSQALELNTKTSLFQLLASKKLTIFTLYGGIGLSSYETDVNMLGDYEVSFQSDPLTNPIQLGYDGSSMRANLGLSIKLLFLNISADYAVQEYNTFTVTAGFSIR